VLDRVTARITSRWLSIGLPFLYFLTSIGFYLHTYDSAQVKITVVQMLGIVLVSMWYLTILCDRDRDWKVYLPIAAPLLASLLSGVVSWSHAAYPGPSLDEALRRVLYIHFALIALTEMKTMERMKRMLWFLMASTAVATLYGLIQFLDWKFYPLLTNSVGLDPFVWRQAFSSRVFSTFGNPNFFGNFLVIVTPITLSFLVRKHSDRPGSVLLFAFSTLVVSGLIWHSTEVVQAVHLDAWDNAFVALLMLSYCMAVALRFSWLGILFFLITLCNTVTVSKGAWVGYAAAMLSFLLLVLFFFPQFRSEKVRGQIKKMAMGLVLLAIITVGIYSRQRVGSLRFRVVTWVSTWEMTQMHPIWGNGIGSFRILYPAFRRPQIFHIEGKHNTETDHAEDEYWEVLMDEGVLGFGIFLWMIATISALGIKALGRFTETMTLRDPVSGKRKTMSEDPRAYYLLGFLAAFWGMLMHNLMDVSLRFVSSGIFLWLLAGLIGALVANDPLAQTDAELEKRQPAEDPSSPAHSPAILVPVYFLAAGSFGWIVWEIFSQFADAQGPLQGPFGEQLLWLIAWSFMLLTAGGAIYAIYQIIRSARHVYGIALLALVMVWPLHIFWGYFMADVHHNRGIYFSKGGQLEQAVASYQKVVTLNPNYIMAYYFKGNVYTDRWGPGDMERAMDEYKKVWKIAPNYVQSHHQAGLVYLRKGQDARKQFDELHAQGHLAEAAVAFNEAKQAWQTSLYYFWKYHAIDPVFEGNYSRAGYVHMQLAELFELEGNKPEAQHQQDLAEGSYKESLLATVCDARENDVLNEKWDHTHRHYNYSYTAQMWADLGNVRFIRGHLSDAVRAYRMSLQINPGNVSVIKNAANAYGRLGRQADMVALLNQLRTVAPQDPDVQRLFHASAPTAHHP
jgi:tetratricopeptide (TPR) repeat protein/O-antigen ligase